VVGALTILAISERISLGGDIVADAQFTRARLERAMRPGVALLGHSEHDAAQACHGDAQLTSFPPTQRAVTVDAPSARTTA
jgi:hypothetical protein